LKEPTVADGIAMCTYPATLLHQEFAQPLNIADCSRCQIGPDEATFSVLDLKAYWRGYKYVGETIKMLREKPDPNLISEIFRRVACLGSIHDTAAQLSPP